MGATTSKIEEDKALQLCRERKKFVRQALDGRCSLATAHVSYVQSLRNTGTALQKFVEPEGPAESSLYTSTSATPEPFALTEKSLSHFSFSSPSGSQHVEVTEALSPAPSPLPKSNMVQVNHMKFRGISSKKVEEKPPIPVTGVVTSSSTPQATTPRSTEDPESSPFKASTVPPETPPPPPWDYFGLSHPIDNQFSEEKGMNDGFENVDNIAYMRKEEGIPDLEDGEDKSSSNDKGESEDSDDEFEEPSNDTLVRSFENFNRMHEHNGVSASDTMPSAGSVTSEKEFLNQEKNSSPVLSPVRPTATGASVHINLNKIPVNEDSTENKIAPKDFISSMKDIETLFIKASESGKEVPRMLEANKLHFRPIFPGKENGSAASTFFKACFACGEEQSQVQEERAQTDVKYLTWHRTESSRSSSSRNPLGLNSEDIGELNNSLFDSIYMISGSHASTLDRLYAWERKLFDEVKASESIRRMYDAKCKILRQLESKGESLYRIDKTRASVKDLHSRIVVAIHRINSISNRIEELRDQELQPQLEELIKGLSRMWEVMFECHRTQYMIISVAYRNSNIKIPVHLESRRQITIHLENELSSLSSSFTKWIGAQKSYLQAINTWLLKCVSLSQRSSKRKKRPKVPPLKIYGPPIYLTCGDWLESLEKLPTRAVADSIKGLAAETAHFLPRQEKNQAKSTNQPYSTSWKNDNDSGSAANMLKDEASDDWNVGMDRFRSSLEGFLGQLNSFADLSVTTYTELEKRIEDAKNRYDKRKSQSEVRFSREESTA